MRRQRRSPAVDPLTSHHQSNSHSGPLLPTTRANHRNSLRSQQASSFLFGGQDYYNLKKKKRKRPSRGLWCLKVLGYHNRRRRRIVVLLIATVSLLFLWTSRQSASDYRRAARGGHKAGVVMLHETSLLGPDKKRDAAHWMPPLQEQILLRRHQKPDPTYEAKQKAIWERVAPDWYHRYNTTYLQQLDEMTTSEPTEATFNAKDTTETKDTKKDVGSSADNAHAVDPLLRTLHTMHLFTNHSQCPPSLQHKLPDVTLVVQATLDRIDVLLLLTCDRWRTSPIIAVVTVHNSSESPQTVDDWKRDCPNLQVLLHQQTQSYYPINQVRNLGLDAVTTSHVVMLDADFVPSVGLDERLRQLLLDHASSATDSNRRQAWVLVAFDYITHDDEPRSLANGTLSLPLPRNFTELQHCVSDQKRCSVFQSEVNWEGHSSTRTHDWLQQKWYDNELVASDNNKNATTPHRLRRIFCFDSFRYEPYVVIPWCPTAPAAAATPLAPFYDERFHGYGKNKIEYISHLRFLGYQFSVVPEGFIVHYPHAESRVKQLWNNRSASDLHSEMDDLYPIFVQELYDKYQDNVQSKKVVALCHS